jgi:regulator of cell morphogenesis and NO signaling
MQRGTRAQPPGEQATAVDWSHAALSVLVQHITDQFHRPLRLELARLGGMMASAISEHGGAFGGMVSRLGCVFADFHVDTVSHIDSEERVLFPAIVSLDRGEPPLSGSWRWLVGSLGMAELEHADAVAALAEMRRLINTFEPPADACPALRGLLRGLEALEGDMRLHLQLESHFLFPRVSALARA